MRNYLVILIFIVFAQTTFLQSFTSSNLPLILINTSGKSIPDEPKIKATMKVINNSNGINKITDKTYEYNGYIGIEMRGNTSQIFYDKKSYALETRTELDSNRNVSLLGMPEENDWVLYGPYGDKSLIRNVLAYHLANSTGKWSPRTKYCEVFINDEYRGIYVLTEKIKIDKNRVDIATLLPTDNSGDELTGGYILRIDRYQTGCWESPYMGRTGSYKIPISYYDPKHDELTEQQKEYIKNYVTDFEHALNGNDFKDPVKGYLPYIDIFSFTDYFFITELSRDLDGYRCSVYFHKDKDSNDGKLVMSPMWDYNLGFGMGNFFEADNPEGWVVEGIGSGDAGGGECVFWWEKLRQDPYFEAHLKYKWEKLRNNAFSDESIDEFIDSCTTLLDKAQYRNFQKFDILNEWVWPNAYIGGSYFAEIMYLKDWITDRLTWLDIQIDKIKPTIVNIEEFKSITNKYQILVYPNPFTESFTLNFSLPVNAKVDAIIRNVLGETVIHKTKLCSEGYNEFVFSQEEFIQNGNLYFYTLVIDGADVKTGKIIKH